MWLEMTMEVGGDELMHQACGCGKPLSRSSNAQTWYRLSRPTSPISLSPFSFFPSPSSHKKKEINKDVD